MVCGKLGDRGVCPLPHDHSGPHETVHGASIWLTKKERDDSRFMRIMKAWGDLTFLVAYLGRHETDAY